MKNGTDITTLARRLQDMRDNSRDFIIPPSKLGAMVAEMTWKEEGPRSTPQFGIALVNGERRSFEPTSWAHNQLGEYADIPRSYYDRMLTENKGVLADMVNHGFAMAIGRAADRRAASGRMLRTHGGTLRALVSSRFRRLDNFDLFDAVAPSLVDLGFEPESCELTDKRLYLKVVTPKLEAEIVAGSVVKYGLVVSNSDVGAGSVRVEPLIWVVRCSNGLITESAIRQNHLGRNLAGDEIEDLLTDETRHKVDAAFWAQVRDVVANTAKPEYFQREVARLQAAAKAPITYFNLEEIVERTVKVIGASVSDKAQKSMVEYLAAGADGAGLNKWGLSNALTFVAQEEELGYDAATELERAGNQIIELNPRQWEVINSK